MKNNIKLATIISYITLIIGNIISIIYTPFMLATLGSKEYGLFTLVNTIISYIYLLDMGLGNAIIRYNSKYMAENDDDGLQKVNGMFLCLYSLIAVIGVIIGFIVYKNLDTIFINGLSLQEINKIKTMFIVAIINLAFSFPLNVFSGIIVANERFVFTKIIALVRTILNPIIMISVLLLGYKSLGMLIVSTIFNISIGFINIFYCFNVLKVKIKFREFNKQIYKEVFRYSFFIFLSAMAYKLYWSTDQIILGMFVGSSAISIYSIGVQFNGYLTSFSNVVSSMFLPKLTKLTTVEKDNKELMNVLIKVSRIQTFIVAFIIIGFILVGQQFIVTWTGSKYSKSYYIALIVMVPQIISIIQTLFATMLEAMNKHRIKAFIYLGVSVLNLIITLILVNYLGAIGCAIGTAIGMIINALLNNIYYKYSLNLNMKYYWSEIGKLTIPIGLSLVMGIVLVKLISPSSYISIGIFVVLFTLLYFAVLWRFAFNMFEKEIILSVVKSISRKKSIA